MNRKSIAIAFGVITGLLAGHASADLATPNSTLRKVEGDTGNCIFSKDMLPFDKEDTYTGVAESFETGDNPREIRCYYPRKLTEYRAVGAFYNQIRDENTYNNYFTIESMDSKVIQYEQLGDYHPDAKSDQWDQMRIPIWMDGGRCGIKDRSELGRDGCIDIDKQVRALAAKQKAALPYAAKVCVSMQFKYSDHYEEKYDSFSDTIKKQRTKVIAQRFASGCITYTAK